jgi:hypothetical protein
MVGELVCFPLQVGQNVVKIVFVDQVQRMGIARSFKGNSLMKEIGKSKLYQNQGFIKVSKTANVPVVLR